MQPLITLVVGVLVSLVAIAILGLILSYVTGQPFFIASLEILIATAFAGMVFIWREVHNPSCMD